MAENYSRYTFGSDVIVNGRVASSKQGMLIGTLSEPPSDAVEGQIYYNTLDKEFYRYTDSGWVMEKSATTRVLESDLEDLENRTEAELSKVYSKSDVDAFLNEKQNRLDGISVEVLTGTGLGVDKVLLTTADGKIGRTSDVDAAHLAHIGNVTSDVQAQLDTHTGLINTKAVKSDVDAEIERLDSTLGDKADRSELKSLETTISAKLDTKADSGTVSALSGKVDAKQDRLLAGANITLSADGTISAKDTTYTAGDSTIVIENGTIRANIPTAATVDDTFIADSPNAVQSKVIQAELAKKLDKDGGTATAAMKLTASAGTARTPVYFSDGVPVAFENALGDAAWKDVSSTVDGSSALPTCAAVQAAVAAGVSGVAKVYRPKGRITTLPEDPEEGDVYNLDADLSVPLFKGEMVTVPAGANIVWTEDGWDKLSENIDLSAYIEKSAIPQGSGKVLLATGTAGTAAVAASVGTATKPIYLNDGVPTACTEVAKATVATKAEQDGAGNVIVNTYATKEYVDGKLGAVPGEANDATITIQRNGAFVKSFTTNQSKDDTIDIEVPTAVSELSDAKDYALKSEIPSTEGFITKDVADLTYYYSKENTYQKSEVYSKDYLDNEFAEYRKIADSYSQSEVYTKDQVDSKIKTVQDAIPDVSVYQTKCIRASGVSVACTTSDSTYTDFPYRGSYSNSNVAATDTAIVTFSVADATSGNLAPVCETYAGGVHIYSKTSQTVSGVSILVVKG